MEVVRMIRLDKYLADMGIGTRQEVKRYIRKGQVMVNETLVLIPETKIREREDEVRIDGKPVGYVSCEYYIPKPLWINARFRRFTGKNRRVIH